MLAVCDVLVLRALEMIGKRLSRAQRSRLSKMEQMPWHEAHTIFHADEATVDKVLVSAWEMLPSMLSVHGCAGFTPSHLASTLDEYVRDLASMGLSHSTDNLRIVLDARQISAVQ